MKLLILAVLLAVMQAAPPVPRHTTDKPNSSTQHIKNDASNGKAPAALSSPSPEVATSSQQQNTANDPKPPNAKQPISVSELPPVSVSKDWMDRTAWGFGLILLIVGIAGVGAAVKTLSTLQRQTTSIEDQTRSLVAQNRAWLILDRIESPHGFSMRAMENRTGRIIQGFGIVWAIRNSGNSPAFIFRIGSRFHRVNNVSELPPEPDIEIDDLLMPTRHYTNGLTLGPGQTVERCSLIQDRTQHPVTPEDYKGVHDGKYLWFAYGVVEYRTVFDAPNIMREMRFCYRWTPMSEDEFSPSDLPGGYTKQT